MTASLRMYDWAETRAGWDALWAATAAGYELKQTGAAADVTPVPQALSWDGAHDAGWLDPQLTLSQTCSLPYRTRLHGDVMPLGSFDFGLPGCAPGYYNSVLVMRADDPRQATENWPDLTLAYNAPDSQSGWAAPYFHARMLGTIFMAGIETGSHAASARAVAEGRADIAALDAQSFRLLQRYDPLMRTLKEIARTEPTPGLPLITRRGWDANVLWAALSQALDSLPAETQRLLDLRGLISIAAARYMELPVPPSPLAVFQR